ncbi:Alg9 mannosyltransferase domain containing protein [Aphelenchoides besseyi]|nr:Alg9 mannosyltransferase domain containing protein [Aphelenchoides besseyi]
MDNIRGSEWFLFMAMMVHLIMAPFTKVEESFNVQAIHDILYLRHNISQYDNLQFPGVVPRTFTGPLFIGAIVSPAFVVFQWLDIQKMWCLFLVRFGLGITVLLSFGAFTRAIGSKFGLVTADSLRFITATQFHFLFYATRPLPNIFALPLVLLALKNVIDGDFRWATRYATTAVILFRFELVLLFGPLYLVLFWNGAAKLLTTLYHGLTTAIVVLAITVPVDSLLWNRWVWPEGEVIWFNLILNKSHEYGIMPFSWYFMSAIPRALLSSIILIPFGLFVERRIRSLFLITITFIVLYSFLPHKELRFIIYAFPLLNLPAAVFLARLWNNKEKSWFHKTIWLGCSMHLLANMLMAGMFLYASARNYPGGDALAHVQHLQRFNRHETRSIHIDVFCAQSGINRFIQFYPSWEYNKTEDLDTQQLQRFDFLLLGSQTNDLRENARANFSQTHKELFSVESFHRISYVRSKRFPYYYPTLKFKEKVLVMKKLDF